MKKQLRKPLKLDTQTIRNLSAELEAAAGGSHMPSSAFCTVGGACTHPRTPACPM